MDQSLPLESDLAIESNSQAVPTLNPPTEPVEYKNNQVVGDKFNLPKDPSMTRFILQNPNGIRVGPGGSLASVLEQHMYDEADVSIYPEINVDVNRSRVRAQIHDGCKKEFQAGQYRAVMAHSDIDFGTDYKPGGVMMIATGRTTGRILSVGSDDLGRWVYMRMNGSAGRVITIIGTYQVCQVHNPKAAGDTTAVKQQYALLERLKRHQPQRVRAHHCRDLCEFVRQSQSQGDLVCVGGDFNETIGENGGGLTRLCSDFGLLDAFHETHGITRFNTHKTGSKCIDYFLVAPELMPSVQACGYEAFHIRTMSDHRCFHLDVNTALFFGSATIPLAPMHARDYTSKQIHNTHKYFAHLTKHLNDHKWFDKIKILEACIATGNPDHELAEDLDRRRIAACSYAGNQLAKYPRAPWSPEVVRLRHINALLKMVIRQKKCPEEDCAEAIQIRSNKLGNIGIEIPESIEDCTKYLRENTKVLKDTVAAEMKDSQNRRRYQEASIQAYTDSGNTGAADIVKKIQRAEATAQVFKQCAFLRGKTKEGGLTYVRVPVDSTRDPKSCKDDQDWKDLVEPAEVASAIRARLQKHFSQAKDCNLTSPPFDITMNFDAACERAEQILTGTLDTTELDDMTTALLEGLASTMDGQVAVSPDMTEEELLGKIKAWKERTSTSPLTDNHLGHAKAYIAQTSLQPDTPEYEIFQKQRAEVIHGHLTLLNYALKFGYSFTRWRSIVNAMLEKDPGDPKIHRLRVIHLYEWDFNLLLCVKWRQLLHHCCDNQLINPACYGTMPGHSSLDPVFIKELEYEVARLTRRPLIHFDNDATSCYDRIPCFLANLASRKYGMHKKVCIVQAKTLAEAKYFLKTKFGISDEYAEHTQECPWFGTGQGSGNSPFYWLLISSSLYDMYCSQTTGGATYTSPDKTLQAVIHLLGFVDDVNNRTNLDLTIDSRLLVGLLENLIQQATKDSQLWHDILTAANQELELSKCKYHFIHFQFESNGAPTMVEDPHPDQPQYPLTIRGKDHQPVPITYVPSSKAIKYLGCQKCPGNQDQQRAALQARCDDYARVINCGSLSRRGTQVFYQAIYRLSVNYPLPVCYFTIKELNKIQQRAHKAMVSGCGFNRYTRREVLFGPSYLGGASFFHLYDEQGHGQLSYFLKSWRSPHTHAGQMLRIAVAWAQYSVGTGTSIFKDTSTKLPHFESKWLASVRGYLATVGGSLQLDQDTVPKLQRQHDKFIMDIVIASGKFKPFQIRMVNYCRLYLRVLTVADISNANGTSITPGAFQGLPSAINTNSNWCHVHQKRPGSRAWQAWRKACRIFSDRGTQVLDQPLGPWTVPANELRIQWQFWHHRQADQLYRRRLDGTFTIHTRMQFDFDADIAAHSPDLPAAAIPVDAASPAPGVYRMKAHYNQWQLPQPGLPPPLDLHGYINQLDDWEQELLQGLVLKVSQHNLFAAVQQEPFLIASDGSQQPDNKASFGWILSTNSGHRLATCTGASYGARITSYRAEGYGVLSACRILHHLRSHFQLQVQACTIVCDNKSMVEKSTEIPKHLDNLYPNSTLVPEWDLLFEIWTTNKAVPTDTRPRIHHIKGHQDKEKPYAELSLRAQLNCDADRLADSYIADHPNHDYSKAPMIPSTKILLHLPLGTITSKLKQELRLARTTDPLIAYLMKRFKWDLDTFHDIDWECSRRANNSLQKHRTTLIKHANDIVAIGKRVNRYDPKYPASCPSCPEPIETSNISTSVLTQPGSKSRTNSSPAFARNWIN